MTKEEAREAIKEAYGNSEYTDEIIKALEQEPILDKIRTEIADIYCGQYCENPFKAASVREMALDIIDKYKASPTGAESEDKG